MRVIFFRNNDKVNVADHCIVMRKGGYPVAIQQCQYGSLDEIERPDGSTL